MKAFGRYLHHHRGTVLAFSGFFAVFALTFWLYRLPMAAVLYPFALCALSGLALLLFGFRKEKQKKRALDRMVKKTAAAIGELPEPASLTEDGYALLVEHLKEEDALLRSEKDARFSDMVDYYTAWAHQIKTPIAAMRLSLQSEDTPKSRRLLLELDRISRYVEMVLAFLRLDSESTDYVFRSVSLDEVIRPVLRKAAPEFIERQLKLNYSPIEKTVVTDEKWLGFVIEQVLSNALKYTREGEITIRLEDPLTLCVSDTGIGIARSDLPRIFEKGYTGRNGRSDRAASGIGLYLCKRICDNLGAKIRADSAVGKGTRIRIDLTQYDRRIE